jgi:hypothetical protein
MSELRRLYDLLAQAAPAIEAYLERKTYAQYRARLWGAMVRMFESGNDGAFMATFSRSIDQQLTEAWNKGAKDVNVDPDEMTNEDLNVLRTVILNEINYARGIADEIQVDRVNKLPSAQFEAKYGTRCDVWANRYNDVRNQARMLFGSKLKFEWVVGPTEESCSTCQALNGIVAYGYEWERSGLRPQNPPNKRLECEGWHCQCEQRPTSKPRTPRAAEKLAYIAKR